VRLLGGADGAASTVRFSDVSTEADDFPGRLAGVLPMPEPEIVSSTEDVEIASYRHPGAGNYLFAHCTGMCAAVWQPMIKALRSEGGGADGATSADAVSLDHRAHGLSGRSGGELSWHGHADDVLSVVDHHGLERPLGVGHSMGGAALILAEQKRPGTFGGLFLYEPIVFPPMPREFENPLSAGARRRREEFLSEEEAFAMFSMKPPMSELSEDALMAYIRYGFSTEASGTITLRCNRNDEAATYDFGPRHGGWDHLGEVTCDVVVAHGGDGAGGAAGLAPAIAAEIPAGRTLAFDSLGHFGPLQDPATVAKALLKAFPSSGAQAG
jgi:pimeloyl-ACP methyl ester carboxylesterase